MHQTFICFFFSNNEYITIAIFKNNLWVSSTQQNQSSLQMSESKRYTGLWGILKNVTPFENVWFHHPSLGCGAGHNREPWSVFPHRQQAWHLLTTYWPLIGQHASTRPLIGPEVWGGGMYQSPGKCKWGYPGIQGVTLSRVTSQWQVASPLSWYKLGMTHLL